MSFDNSESVGQDPLNNELVNEYGSETNVFVNCQSRTEQIKIHQASKKFFEL